MTSIRTIVTSEKTRQKSAILYRRVSTAEQAESGLGLAAQEFAMRAECERRGWDVVRVFTDAGISGKSLNGRPALAEALAMIDVGAAQTIMVSKLDRLSRSLVDFASLMARAQRDGWNLVALDLGIDLGTPAGEFLASVMASAAVWERRLVSQRTKDALAVKRAQGVVLGRPSGLPREVIENIVEMRSFGLSFARIAARLNQDRVATAQGGRAWYPATVRAVLRSQAATEFGSGIAGKRTTIVAPA